MTITTAMVLAAGLGTRMRPLTLDRPKALVELGGRPLIEHGLDRLAAAGVRRVIVNVHAFAEALEARVARRTDLEISFSDERARLLDTGGALKKARPLLGDDPVFVLNIDSIWTEGGSAPTLTRLADAFDTRQMASLLLLAPTESLGFSGRGDFSLSAVVHDGGPGRLQHRGERASAPFAYAGAHVLDPRLIDAWPDGAFGLLGCWLEMQAQDRLWGLPLQGRWMHVGDPVALAAAESELAGVQ
ncbi:MAG TPA: nucleotidyltransferase family protein [Caulobacteraceae bacterium]|nr:nucleotidyltransferase family protein [Caulobacteraceae bacterium]